MKHHYIPQFLLRRWAGSNGKLVQFLMTHAGSIHTKKVYPSETGFTRGLYALPTDQNPAQSELEEGVFQKIDSGAASALKRLEALPASAPVHDATKRSWATFIASLLIRAPEDLESIVRQFERRYANNPAEEEERYAKLRRAGDPERLSDFLKDALQPVTHSMKAELLTRFLYAPEKVDHITGMEWAILDLSTARKRLLLSDRPVIITNGIVYPESQIILPVSPWRAFLACNSVEVLMQACKIPATDVVSQINKWVCGQAVKFVYSSDEKPLRYVEKNFGKSPQRRLVDVAGPEALQS